jgi:paraquat-inducible protein A
MAARGTTLHRDSGRWGWVFLAFLTAALGLQVTALALPFVHVSVFLAGAEDYRLVHTAQLLWEAKLYLLAGLIVGFSVIFPFVKIAGIAVAWLGMSPGLARSRLLGALGKLGKWSMIDPLAVCLLVVFASDQWAVSANTKPGVICFLSAITIAMVLSAVAQHRDRLSAPDAGAGDGRPEARVTLDFPWTVIVPGALCTAACAFVSTLDVPLLQVNQFLLKDNSFGLMEAGQTLFANHHWALAVLVWGGLIVAPAAVIIVQLAFWLMPASRARLRLAWHAIAFLREWSMLEVFAVALALFLAEGGGFIKTEMRAGFWLLFGAIGAQLLSNVTVGLALRRSLGASRTASPTAN